MVINNHICAGRAKKYKMCSLKRKQKRTAKDCAERDEGIKARHDLQWDDGKVIRRTFPTYAKKRPKEFSAPKNQQQRKAGATVIQDWQPHVAMPSRGSGVTVLKDTQIKGL